MASNTINGSTSNKNITCKIEWSSSPSTTYNRSEVTASLYYRRTNTYSGTQTSGNGTFSITIDGQKESVSTKLTIPNDKSWVLAITVTKIVNHNTDGTKSIAISASGSIASTSLTSTTCGGTAELDKIARASTITAAAGVTLGNKCDVRWTPLSASFRYKLEFTLGNWKYTTGAIHPNTTLAYKYSDYIIPLDVARQITDGPNGLMTVKLYSYSNVAATEQIGSADPETFVVTVPKSLSPTLTMSLSPVHSLPETFDGLYIQGLSQVKANLNSTTQYGANVNSYDVTVDGVPYGVYSDYTSGYLMNSGLIAVVGHVKDSRTYDGYVEDSITVIPYAKPKILNATAKRCDQNGNLTDSGTYLKITAKRNYYPVVSDGVQKNHCAIQYRYKEESASYYSDWITILDPLNVSTDEVVTAPLLGTLLATNSYRVEIQAIDLIGSSPAIPILILTDKVYWHRDGARNSLGLGKYNEQDNALDMGWDIHMNEHRITGLADPVANADAVSFGYLKEYIKNYIANLPKG